MAGYERLHEWFYRSLLTTVHSVPIQSLWLVMIDDIPVNAKNAELYENGKWSLDSGTFNELSKIGGSTGMIFARAVKIPGDGINTSKSGSENTGVLKANIGTGRKELENLNISFIETNFSFTDTLLRPWSIMVGHKSLKDSTLRKDITIIQLAKAGSGKTLIERGKWVFRRACPVSIQTQEYNYGGDNVLDRDIEFIYDHYEYTSGSSSDIPTGVVSSILNALGLDRLSRLGEQLTTGVLEKIKDLGTDLLKGTTRFISTNVIGQASEAVDRLIREGEASLRDAVGGVESSITGATQDAINNITRFNANRDVINRQPNELASLAAKSVEAATSNVLPELNDTPYGGKTIAKNTIIEKNISTDDQMRRVREPLTDIAIRKAADTRIDVEVPKDDTPIFNEVTYRGDQPIFHDQGAREGGSTFATKTSQRGQLPPDGLTGERSFTGNATDSAKSATKNNSDTPIFFAVEGRDSKKVAGNNATGKLDVPNTKLIPVQFKSINQSDVVKTYNVNTDKIPEVNDAISKPGEVSSQSKAINNRDTAGNIRSDIKTVPRNTTVGNTVQGQIKVVKRTVEY